jgi:hypothetical protein
VRLWVTTGICESNDRAILPIQLARQLLCPCDDCF